MKTVIFLVLMISAVSVNAQSLKETLFSGKLKTDSGTVIRKGEDLSTKIDTAKRKPVEAPKVSTNVAISTPNGIVIVDSVLAPAQSIDAGTVAAVAKDNNAIWKNYIDELTTALRTEVIPNKKVKDGNTYSILIEYEIQLDGSIVVSNVSVSPESSYLQQQVKERLTLTAPQLNPVLMSNGKPRKATKKQMITIAK